jgi:ferric iron reductase protein FhuF
MPSSPIAETLAMLAQAKEDYRPFLLSQPDEVPGWLTVAELTAESNATLPAVLRASGEHHKAKPGDEQSPAALWLGHYAFFVMAGAMASYMVSQRVPDLSAANMSIRFDEDGEPAAIAWTSTRFAALQSDPAAGYANCQPMTSADELRAHLIAGFVDHFTPVVDALKRNSRLGKAGLWGIVTDTVASTFSWIGQQLGVHELALNEARLIAASDTRLNRKVDFVFVEEAGLSHCMAERNSCCFYFRVEDGGYCSNCPHRQPEERVQIIRDWLNERAKAEAAPQ